MQAIAALSSAASALKAVANGSRAKKKKSSTARKKGRASKTKTSLSPGNNDTLVLRGGSIRRNSSRQVGAATAPIVNSLSSGAFRNRIFSIPNVRIMLCSMYTTAGSALQFGTLAAGGGVSIIDFNPVQAWGSGNFAPFGVSMSTLAVAFRLFRVTRMAVRYYGAGPTTSTSIFGFAYDPDAAVSATTFAAASGLQDSKFFCPYTPLVEMPCSQLNTGWKYIYNVSGGADDERWQSAGSLICSGLALQASLQGGMVELDYDIEFTGLGREDLLTSGPPATRNDGTDVRRACEALYRFNKETNLLSEDAAKPPALPSTASSSSSSSMIAQVEEPESPDLVQISQEELTKLRLQALTYADRTR